MQLRKAIEDLREITLAALPGRWQKLLYFARLRRASPGKYSHWSFEKKYGTEAEPALREAHAEVYRDLLRAPISELLDEGKLNQVAAPLLADSSADTMVPLESDGQSESHFRYVLASVRALLRSQKKDHR
jgi:hypothetical protein